MGSCRRDVGGTVPSVQVQPEESLNSFIEWEQYLGFFLD